MISIASASIRAGGAADTYATGSETGSAGSSGCIDWNAFGAEAGISIGESRIGDTYATGADPLGNARASGTGAKLVSPSIHTTPCIPASLVSIR